MIDQVLIGCLLILITSMIHAGGMALALNWLQLVHSNHNKDRTPAFRSLVVGFFVLIMFVVTLIETVVWAYTYLLVIDGIQQFGRALYFSMVTYTTLGYGDIVLPDEWQLLSSLQAANGVMIFGWTTALIVAVIREVYGGIMSKYLKGKSAA